MFDPVQFEPLGGICIVAHDKSQLENITRDLSRWASELQIRQYLDLTTAMHQGLWVVQMHASALLKESAPNADVRCLADSFGFSTTSSEDELLREIVFSKALSPVASSFPSVDEFFAALRVRRNIALIARRTELWFSIDEDTRPATHWRQLGGDGFALIAGQPLSQALELALCPDASGQSYGFACRQASEYLMLAGLAQELETTNPQLLEAIERRWGEQPLRGEAFINAFLTERGSRENPFPKHHYVPGSRVWFKNPDEDSTDVDGFEGSWVVYMGAGKFVNLWDKKSPYDIETKCFEVYHWRHCVERTDAGILRMNEDRVKDMMAASMADPATKHEILHQMMEYRAPVRVYGEGGCIDLTRENARWVCPQTTNICI